LVSLAKQGDKLAFRILVDRHKAALARTIVGMIGDRGSVDDVLQDVFIQFHNSLDKFRGDAAVKTYLSRIAVNKSLDLLRRRKRWHKRFLSRDETPIMEVDFEIDPADQSDRKRRIWSAIDSLPDAQRSVLVLRMIDGYSTEETAELLSIEYGTVLSRLSRGMSKLRDLLGPLFESGVSRGEN
jgi:RNA polymerase sigma-70 factor (ECF subfamily)